MSNMKYYQLRLFLIRFFIIGMTSYIVEIYFTGTISLIKAIYSYFTVPNYIFDLNQATQGHVGIFAFFVYCWAAIPFTFMTNPLKKIIKNDLIIPNAGRVIRGIIYGLVFMLIEFVIGLFMVYVLHTRAWDYRNLPLNVLGIVTFSFLPAWTIAGMIGEWFHDRLLQIDDILLNPGLFNRENILGGFNNYQFKMKQKLAVKQAKKNLAL
ncbi:putative ABC transporter permease [bacterium]|nr:putative ABC transporter permease [bacterium]